MFKFGDYTIKRIDTRNFLVEVRRKNSKSEAPEGKRRQEYVNARLGYYGSFKQAVERIANDVVLTADVKEILNKLDEISKMLKPLDVKIVCEKLSTGSIK